MYWWNTQKLASEIKSGELTEEKKKNYYIGTSVIYLLSVYILAVSPRSDGIATLIEAIGVISITLLGIKITFQTNKENDGVDFIGRSLSLSFPILIQVIAIGFAFGLVLALAAEVLQTTQIEIWSMPIFAIIIQAWYFWRINVHLKVINS